MFHSYFWTPTGQPLSLETVQNFRNFQAEPFVEVEDVFVSKAVRALQVKLRECIVYPPMERPSTRSSVCFPERVCSVQTVVEANHNPQQPPTPTPTPQQGTQIGTPTINHQPQLVESLPFFN